jgi:hypothetical protein
VSFDGELIGDANQLQLAPGRHRLRAVLLDNFHRDRGYAEMLTKSVAGYQTNALAFSNPVEVEVQAAALAPQKFFFGPVMERVLPVDDRALSDVLDLDSGQVVKRPASWQYAVAPHDRPPAGVSIYGRETQMINCSGETHIGAQSRVAWETLSADNAVRKTEKALASGASAREDELPKCFVFKTQSGNIGLLQIAGFTENPRGVKIHYKLVSSAR